MTNLVAIREVENGARNLVLQLDIQGDGVTEITDLDLVEVAGYGCEEVRLNGIKGQIAGFTLKLEWGGTTKAPLFQIDGDNYVDIDWDKTGGLTNPKVPNYTGDVVLNSSGLVAGEVGSLQFHFIKKRIL